MVEIILVLVGLLGMGVYFVKSSDLPKELKDRQAYLNQNPINVKRNFNFETKLVSAKKNVEKKLDRSKIENEINKLTYEITRLEQEIKANDEKNFVIKKTINKHLIRLTELNDLLKLA